MNNITEINEIDQFVRAEAGIMVGELSDKIRQRWFHVNTVSVPYYNDTLDGMITGVVGGGYNLFASSNDLSNKDMLGLKVGPAQR